MVLLDDKTAIKWQTCIPGKSNQRVSSKNKILRTDKEAWELEANNEFTFYVLNANIFVFGCKRVH